MSGFNTYSDFVTALPDDALLGSLVWFSISDADVPFDKVHEHLDNFNLKHDGLRKRIRPVDAFKKASKIVARNFGRTDNGIDTSVLVRQVGQDTELSYRHIILERAIYKAGSKRKLVYETVGEILFRRGDLKNGTYTGYGLRVTRKEPPGLVLSEEEEQWLDEKLAAIQPTFDHMMSHLDSHAIRTFVREYIVSLSGILVKENGGVYFVPQEHVDELRNLAAWVRSIGSSFRITPLVNFDEQREMLAEAFEEDMLRDVHQMSAEVSKILTDRTRTIRDKTYNQYTERASELIVKLDEYKDRLGDRLESAADTLTTFKLQLLALGDRVSESSMKTD